MSKTNLYRLWYHIKIHGYGHSTSNNVNSPLNNANRNNTTTYGEDNLHHSTEDRPRAEPDASNMANIQALDIPQLRHFLFATTEHSGSAEMVALVQSYLNAAMQVPKIRNSAYVLSLFQVSAGTFNDEGCVTSKQEGWLKVRMWLKGNTGVTSILTIISNFSSLR